MLLFNSLSQLLDLTLLLLLYLFLQRLNLGILFTDFVGKVLHVNEQEHHCYDESYDDQGIEKLYTMPESDAADHKRASTAAPCVIFACC